MLLISVKNSEFVWNSNSTFWDIKLRNKREYWMCKVQNRKVIVT